ncbi:MAG: peptidase U35 [Mesorhizobium sp.]|nr:MAG: peptidase U35 [Mesorhizobium sp.]
MSAAPKPNPADLFDPMAIAMLNRHSPGIVRAAFGDDVSRAHPGIGLRDAAAAIASKTGGRAEIRAMMTTDDFLKILSDTVSVSALAAQIINYPEILRISHETTYEDFREKESVQGGLFPELLPPGEGGEVQYGTIGERKEKTFAVIRSRMIEITTEALVNDNLGLLVQPALRIGETVLDGKARVIVNRIESNPVLSDGVAVFHANHSNLAAAGAALDVTTLSAGRLAMRRQKDLDGLRDIGVNPSFLVIPPELETTAEQLLAVITAATVDEVNPFSGKLTPVVEHRLTNPKAWYLFARPERQMGLEHGTVNGMDDPEVRTEAPINRHAVITRVSTAFGAGWIDYRGAYKNAGPA